MMTVFQLIESRSAGARSRPTLHAPLLASIESLLKVSLTTTPSTTKAGTLPLYMTLLISINRIQVGPVVLSTSFSTMPQTIKITNDKGAQVVAARALSSALDTLGVKHAIFGGFAVALYGNMRTTNDIDILVDVAEGEIRDILRGQITQLDQHFVEFGLKYYFAPRLMAGLAGEQLVLANEENILVETLPTNSLGLPPNIDASMIIRGEDMEEGSGDKVLITPKA